MRKVLCVCAAVATLAGCGGGGSNPPVVTDTMTIPQLRVGDTYQYTVSGDLTGTYSVTVVSAVGNTYRLNRSWNLADRSGSDTVYITQEPTGLYCDGYLVAPDPLTKDSVWQGRYAGSVQFYDAQSVKVATNTKLCGLDCMVSAWYGPASALPLHYDATGYESYKALVFTVRMD
jgi:hypothetical protein